MKQYTIAIFACLLLLSSCKKDKGSLTMVFKPGYDGKELVLFEGQPFSANADINFSAANFFLSEAELVKSDGSTVSLNEIDLVDVGATTQAAAEAGTKMEFKDLEPGEYSALRFNIGVPSDLNKMKTTDFAADHALANTAYYWDNWQSYIFSKTEGNLDTLKNGVFDMGWIVHTGKSSMIRGLSTPNKVNITEGGNTEVEFFIDFKTLLSEANGEPFNLKEKPRNHHKNDTLRIRQYVDNYATGGILIRE